MIAPKSIQSHSPYVPVRYRILLSSLLSPAKALLLRHCCLPHPAADFIRKSPFSTLSHHLPLHCRAAGSAFLLALTLPSLSRCFRHCGRHHPCHRRRIPLPVAPLPSLSSSSSSRHRCCRRHRCRVIVAHHHHCRRRILSRCLTSMAPSSLDAA